MVVSGSQQALEIAARVLLEPGQPAWVEEPGYAGARDALKMAGARLVPVPVDDEGLDVAAVKCASTRLRPPQLGQVKTPSASILCSSPAPSNCAVRSFFGSALAAASGGGLASFRLRLCPRLREQKWPGPVWRR
jgi:hypothetical protein